MLRLRALGTPIPPLAIVAIVAGAVLGGSACSGEASPAAADDAGGGDPGTIEPPPGEADAGACVNDDACEGKCVNGTCASPTTTDGKRSPSLGETDVDCGGPSAPACIDGKTCVADGDCASRVCGATKTCAPAPSCRGAFGPEGVATCGAGEPGTSGAAHESCCRSLPLPQTTARRLDRYEITAGRIRNFIDGIAGANGGVPDVRGFAKTFAASHPGSQLASVADDYPGLLDVLPNQASATAPVPLPLHLGIFPIDPINASDGCFVAPGTYGHPTYWQDAAMLKPFGAGDADGKRRYGRDVLDAKAMNCVMPLLLAAFCAWDGGELARTTDYHAIWGRRPKKAGATTVMVPWNDLLPIGKFDWRNGHGTTCIEGWPGCMNPQPYFYAFPTVHVPADDDTPAIGAPGRFPDDVTAIVSAQGEGWFDVGGNMLEAAWPTGTLPGGANPTVDVCDISATAGPGETACSRQGKPGVRRYAGALPRVALVGYSWEGHARRSEAYLASTGAGDEGLIEASDAKTVTIQYGKIGGRCARPATP